MLFCNLIKGCHKNQTRILFISTLGHALLTLFQLFTLDHWYDILRDMIKVADSVMVKIYIILWICIGAFIFRNIFAGIMGECILLIFKHLPFGNMNYMMLFKSGSDINVMFSWSASCVK